MELVVVAVVVVVPKPIIIRPLLATINLTLKDIIPNKIIVSSTLDVVS